MSSEMRLFEHRFSHLYVEKDAEQFEDTRRVLRKFRRAHVVSINDYREVFARPRQNWEMQRKCQSLILAVRKGSFLYPAAAPTLQCGCRNMFYTTLVLNCLYDCHYCYLQGLYPSANMVAFVNHDDFFAHTSALLKQTGDLHICLSYETDLAAFEGIIPHCRRWISFASSHPNITLEIRTKNGNTRFFSGLEPRKNVILAWTLSPAEVAKCCEPSAPSLEARVRALKSAVEEGWRVRVCFDPLLDLPSFEDAWENLIALLFTAVRPESLYEVHAGCFRMSTEQFRKARSLHPRSPVFSGPFEEREGMSRYATAIEQRLRARLQELLVERGCNLLERVV